MNPTKFIKSFGGFLTWGPNLIESFLWFYIFHLILVFSLLSNQTIISVYCCVLELFILYLNFYQNPMLYLFLRFLNPTFQNKPLAYTSIICIMICLIWRDNWAVHMSWARHAWVLLLHESFYPHDSQWFILLHNLLLFSSLTEAVATCVGVPIESRPVLDRRN